MNKKILTIKTLLMCTLLVSNISWGEENSAAAPTTQEQLNISDSEAQKSQPINNEQEESSIANKWNAAKESTKKALQQTKEAGGAIWEAGKESSQEIWADGKDASGQIWNNVKEKSGEVLKKSNETLEKMGELLDDEPAEEDKKPADIQI